MKTEEYGSRRDTLLLSQLDNDWHLGQGRPGAAEGRVRHDVHARGGARVQDLLLRQPRVVLDLVHGRGDLGLREELVEVLFAVL